ncbi:MAG: serine protease [Bacteroidia bacterium]|nr:serine protease [Bacteroidia bacterium]
MKKKIKILMSLLFIAVTTFAQKLDGYKYAVFTPLIYNNQRDIYGIEAKAISGIQTIGLTCLDPLDFKNWPGDAKAEPCLIIYISFAEGKPPNALTCGAIRITGKNCKNQVIFDEIQKSKSNAYCYSPYTCCYPKWADAAESFFKELNYKYDEAINTLKTEYPEVEATDETEETIKLYLTTNKVDQIEGIYKSYQSDQLSYYKFGIIKQGDKFKAIIIESDSKQWKQGEVKAIFEQSSMRGFYSVKWFMSDKTSNETFGIMDNDAMLTIEFKNQQTGEKYQDKFIKMFPSSSSESTFKKDNSKASGSGFFLTTEGIIATNAHVVEGALNIEVTISNDVGNFIYKAKVLLVDSKNDVALLQIDDDKFKGLTSIPYGIAENSDVGSAVFTIGYPLNDVMGTNYKVTDGIISSKSGVADDVRYYQISVPLQPGNSGGPLFNKDGNVIGITSSKLNSQAVGTPIENVNYAIKSSYLLNIYNMLPNAAKLSSSSQVSTKELQDQVKVLKNFVCLIRIF